MRYLNTDNDLKLYAVAGTQTVLLAFDLNKTNANGNFMGFYIERSDDEGKVYKLNGTKHFDSLVNDNSITDPEIKYTSLVQSFFWKDYLADPGKQYIYTVKAMFGTAQDFSPKYESVLKVTTEELNYGKHSIYFNYGVTGSQGYANNKDFGNKPIDELDDTTKQKALDYLSRDLYHEGLLTFIKQAKTKSHSLYCAFYEIEYQGILNELKEIKKKAKNLEIVYSAQAGQNKDLKDPTQDKGNISSLDDSGLLDEKSHKRTKANQPHNKFMILCKDEKPIEVWTGSTNLTLSGIFGQSNTGHWIKDEEIAKKYKKYWDLLKDNPSLSALSKVSEEIQQTVDLTKLGNGSYVFFSPRNLPLSKDGIPPQLLSYVNLIDNAKELVCMIFPFNYDEIFKIVYDKDKDYLRLLIFEKESQAKLAKSNSETDQDLKVTAGAILEKEVKNFISEVSPKTTVKGGVLFVHNKFIIIDPLGSNPSVLTGSANFSRPSIKNNDENSLFIKGDPRVADIYLTEFNRLFEHFWPRYLQSINSNAQKEGFERPLDEKYTWFKSYFEKDSYHHKRGQLFINMKGAKKG
jgi:hypothetical protein